MEMPVSYRIHSEVSQEGIIRKNKSGCARNNQYIMPLKNVEIMARTVCEDCAYLNVTIQSKLSVSDFMGYLKGGTCRELKLIKMKN